MNASVEINLLNKHDNFYKKYDFFQDYSGNLRVIINTSIDDSFRDVSNNEKIKEGAISLISELKLTNFNGEFDSIIEDLNEFVISETSYQSDYYTIRGNYEDIKYYIDSNKEFDDKKIIIGEYFKLENDHVNKVIDSFKEYKDIFIKLEGNDDIITVNELEKTLNIIEGVVLSVRKLGFSPLEEIMYVYDKVRDRFYVEEKEEDDKTLSRDLTKVLLGDKIVCAGYANLFNVILKKLGYKSSIYKIIKKEKVNGKNIGHIRNMVYVNDKKYNVNGIYYFDTTWDNKKDINNSFLYSYKYFSKTKKEIESYKKGKYIDVTLPFYTEELIKIFSDVVLSQGLEYVSKDIINQINFLSKLIDEEKLITPLMIFNEEIKSKSKFNRFNYEYVMNKLIEIDELFNKTISADILLKVLYNVRKLEYYEDSNKYPFDIVLLYSVVVNSNWVFKNNMSNLLIAIFGCEISKKLAVDTKINFEKFLIDNDIEKNISQIKLTKTLRYLCEKKNND